MNEKCYIVIYKLKTGEQEEKLREALKVYAVWAKLTDNSLAIITNESAIEIRDFLMKALSDGDSIFVIRSGIEAAWSNLLSSSEWLRENLIK